MLQITNRRFQDDPLPQFFPAVFFELSPLLAELDAILSDAAFLGVIQEHARRNTGSKQSLQRGRPGVPLECFVRLKSLKVLYHCGWEELFERVSDSLKLRRFCHVALVEELPDKSTLVKLDKKYAGVGAKLNEIVLRLAQARDVLRGERIRGDTTVVEANIHPPTDGSILSDGVRVVCRTVRRVTGVWAGVGEGFQALTRRARGMLLEVVRVGREKTEAAKQKLMKGVGKIADLAYGVAQAAARVLDKAKEQMEGLPEKAATGAKRLVDALQHGGELLSRIVQQTRRVLSGEKSIEDRVVSVHDPQARPIVRGKAHKRVEFGYKVYLQQTQGGFISSHLLEKGNPADVNFPLEGVRRQKEVTGVRPQEGAYDRGFDSDPVRKDLRAQGMNRVSIPKRQPKSATRKKYEKQPWFVKLQKFRAGIEGTISVANRRVQLKQARSRGLEAVRAETDWKVFGFNLRKLAETMMGRCTRKVAPHAVRRAA